MKSDLRVFLLFGVLSQAGCATVEDPPAHVKPNIIFIIADDLGYGDLGSYGQSEVRTPRLDGLAHEGVRFTDFYAGSTVCAPSRCVLMTGLHLGHAYIRGNGKLNLRPQDRTIAEVLKEAGYKTGHIGKWGLGHEGSTGLPTRKGFDYFFGYLDQHHAHNYYPSFLIRNESRVPLPNVVPNEGEYGQGVASEKVEYSHDAIAEEALRFIRDSAGSPFFLYLALTIPHANNEAGDDGMEVPDLGDYVDRDWPEQQKQMAAMVSRMDRDVGRILDLLVELGIDEETVVFFTSDNGPHREGGNDPDFFDSNGDLRGIKRDLYEGGIRVPLIVRWPGLVQAGSASRYVGYFGDVFATLAEIAGVEIPAGLDSTSFLPSILGKESEQVKNDFLYWEFYEQGSAQAVRRGEWKAVRKPMLTGNVELFNLQEDLSETVDLSDQYPEVVSEMVGFMEKAHVPSPLWKVPGND